MYNVLNASKIPRAAPDIYIYDWMTQKNKIIKVNDPVVKNNNNNNNNNGLSDWLG